MDIRTPKKRFSDQLDRALHGQPVDETELLSEEIEILHLVQKIKESEPQSAPSDIFSENLRKKLLNIHQYHRAPSGAAVTEESGNLLSAGGAGLLARPRRSWVWAAVPIVVVALLVIFTSFAAASPGFYEKFVPAPLKQVLREVKVVQTGSIAVSSLPSNARVFLNGRESGSTPLQIDQVRVGEHQITVKLDGYMSVERTVTVVAEEIAAVEMTLEKVTELKEVPPTTQRPSDVTDIAVTQDQIALLTSQEKGLALSFGASGGGQTQTAYKILADAKLSALGENGTLFIGGIAGDGFSIFQISPSGELRTVVEKAAGQLSDLKVATGQKGLVYVANVENGAVAHFFDLAQGTDKVLLNLTEGRLAVLGIKEPEIILAQTRVDGLALVKLLKLRTDGQVLIDLSLPTGAYQLTPGEVLVGSDFDEILLKNKDGLVSQTITQGEPKTIYRGNVTAAQWLGSGEVLVATDKKVERIDVKAKEAKEVYLFQPGQVWREMGADAAGENIAILCADNLLVVVDPAGASTALEAASPIKDYLGFRPPKTFSPGDKTISLEELSVTSKDLTQLGTLSFNQASGEKLTAIGDNVVRVSDGDKSLEVVGLADPAKPQVVGSLAGQNFTSDLAVTVSGTRLVVAGGVLEAIDVSQPAAPKVISRETVDVHAVAMAGETVYAISSDKIYTYSLASGKLTKKGESALPVKNVLDLTASDSQLFVAAGEEGIVILDMTKPAKPVEVKRLAADFARQIFLTDRFLLVAVGAPGGEGAIDVYQRDTLEKVKALTPDIAQGSLLAAGSRVYAADPAVSVAQIKEDGEIEILSSAKSVNAAVIPASLAVVGDKLVVLRNNTLTVYQLPGD